MNEFYSLIVFCSRFISILWFVLIVYKIICVKFKIKYKFESRWSQFKFTYVFSISIFICFIYLFLFKWHKYQIVFSIIEGILITLITIGIIAFLYVNHYLTTEPLSTKYDKKLYSRIRKYSAIAVSVCMILFDIVPFFI